MANLEPKAISQIYKKCPREFDTDFQRKILGGGLDKALICSNEPYYRSNRKLLLIGEGDGKDVISYESVQACQRRIVW
jgi:hypothetical protein